MLWLPLILAFGSLGLAKGPPPGFSYPAPNAQAFKGWQRLPLEESSDIDLYRWEKAVPACDRPGIFPTHPQMSLKRYHLVLAGEYDHFRLTGQDAACAFGGKKPDGRGIIPCFRPDVLHYFLFSDTYQDACGNRFRGVKELSFFHRDENMGTLFSPGRGMLRKPGLDFDDYMVSPTYRSAPEDFLFFVRLFPGDEATIEKDRERALHSEFLYNENTDLFERR